MKAIVTGVSGQDGYYMTRRLLAQGYEVLGLTTSLERAQKEYADVGGNRLTLQAFDYRTIGAVTPIVEGFQPNYIFNLAAKATGLGMFDAPQDMSRLNGGFVLDILECMRQSTRRDQIVFCQACSSEMFGDTVECPQSETTPFWPKSPYGAAKLFAHNMVRIYRTIHGLRCCSAILYNHESVRRSTEFVTKKITNAAARIKLGLLDSVSLGSLESRRDWGYAPEYVEAMQMMAFADVATDYVVATGNLNTVRDLCHAAFGHLGLDYRTYVRTNSDDVRVTSSVNLQGNPAKINAALGWHARKSVREIMAELVEYEVRHLAK